jgi:hypothetical protein
MKPISSANGRINEGLSEIRDLNEKGTTKQPVFGSSVVMGLSEPMLSKTLELKHFNLLSQKKVTAGSISIQILESIHISPV